VNLSDTEALMWSLERDPVLRSTFLNVTFLDRAPDVDRFRRRMARATELIPRLRQRIEGPSLGRGAVWADDPDFDLDYHVRHVAIPGVGTDRQLLDSAAISYQDAFDPSRPLWQLTIVEGLEDGRAAMLAKMHHTITDGVGGIRLSAMFIDLERGAADPAAPVAVPYAESPEGIVSEIGDALLHGLRRQLGMSRRAAVNAADVLLHPLRLPRQAANVTEITRSLARQMVVTDRARSPLWAGRRSLSRHFEVLSVDLERLKSVANALGGTINDAFVCGVAGGAGAYHRAKGVEVDELRVSMPINTRTDKSAGGNSFTPTRALIPAGTKDPVERFQGITARLNATKGERAVGFTDLFAGFLNALPTSVVVRLARQQVETVDFATSNLRGAPWDLFIAGAEILGNHPMGPTGGTAFNATVLSYRGMLDMGLNIDTAAVDDPGLLRDCIAESFDELLTVK
jgi:WS/DGAT/MGAT family acyltransferase